MAKHRGNRARSGNPDLCPKQPQVGCKCKLARKLLELLMRSATANKMSVKVGILRKWRHNLERQPGRGATRRLIMAGTHLSVLEASLEELYQGQRRLLVVMGLADFA
ncbi:hypothetical protein GW17_00035456 [Ensete ventricosum]|nr:hypothetical protein GW17_00035456 [Ensete ventricosum]